MTRLLHPLGYQRLVTYCILWLVAWSAGAQTPNWVKGFGGTLNDVGSAVAVDSSGNIVLAGWFKGTANFGGGNLNSAGGATLVVAKYSNLGVHQWSFGFGSTGDEQPTCVGVDASGNIYVAGYFTGTGNLGGTNLVCAGQYDCFLAKYSSTGTHLWSERFGSTGIDQFNGLTIDSHGNVVVVGTFAGTVNFGGTNLLSLFGSSFDTVPAIVLAKYAPTGAHIWSETFANNNNNYGNAIAIDSGDNAFLTGQYSGYVDFGGGRLASPTGPNPLFYVAKMNSNGGYVFAKSRGGTGSQNGKGNVIAVDGNGDVIVGGGFYKSTDLGGGAITGIAVNQDCFIAKYSGVDGSYIWANPITGNNGAWPNGLRCDSHNNPVMVGYYFGTFNFGARTISSVSLSYDIFAVKYSSAGTPVWANSYGGTATDWGNAVAFDSSDHPIITGLFAGTASFGGFSLTSAGASDAFLMQLSSSNNTWYVATTGNDTTGDGSLGNPWATGTKAASVAQTGDTVNVASGWYLERVTLPSSGVMWRSTGTNNWSTAGATNWGFEGNSGVNSISISGFYCHNTNSYGGGIANDRFSGIYIVGTGWTVTNCAIWENGIFGVNIDGRTNSGWGAVGANLIVNNRIWTNGLSSVNCAGTNNLVLGNDMGFNTRYTAYDTNVVAGTDADGMYVFGWNNVIQSNYIHGVNYRDPKNAPVGGDNGAHCDGIQSWGPGSGSRMGQTHDCLFVDNVIDGTIGGVMVANGYGIFQEGCSNMYHINNVIRWHSGIRDASTVQADPCFNMHDLNNTLVGQTNDNVSATTNSGGFNFVGGVAMSLGYCTNAVWQNNICINWTNSIMVPNSTYSGLTSSSNLKFRDDGVAVIEDATYAPFAANDTNNVNPLFSNIYANPPSPTITLTSPAINTGTPETGIVTNDFAGTVRPQSGAWDIGAFEAILVNDPLITRQPQSTNIYSTQTALFSLAALGNSALSYQWRTNSVNTGTNGPALAVGPSPVAWSGMSVLCVVSDANGSVTSAVATLTVLPDPAITTQPANATVSVGNTATFSVVANGQSALSYQWSKNGTPIGGATASSYTTPATIISDNNSHFSVLVTDTAGNVQSATATLTVIGPDPVITSQPQSTNIFATQKALFSISASGASTLSYQWKTNGVSTGTNGPALSVGPAPVAWNGMTVLCVVSDLAGSVTSSVATLTVGADPVISAQPQNATTGVGLTASFSVTATGQSALSYQWSRNGSAIGGATSSSFTTPATTAANNGDTYFVTVTDTAGSLQSANATLTVTNIVSPPDPVITSQPQSTNIFVSQSALFKITATGGSTLAYQWKTNGVATGTNGPAFSIGPCPIAFNGLAVLCAVSDLAGSITSSIATLGVGADPVISTQPANATVSVGNTATFSVTATGQTSLSYQWSKNGVAIGGATSSSYTTPATTLSDNNSQFFVTVTDSAGSLQSANATLTVIGPDPVITSQPKSTNVFSTQLALFRISASGATTLSYQWKTNAVNAGTNGPALSLGPCPTVWSGMTVLCIVSDVAGSVTSSTATLTVSPDPVISVQPHNASSGVNQQAAFSVTASGQTALSYQWSRNGAAIGGATLSSYTTPLLSSINNGDAYFADVTDSAGTLRSASATLTITNIPPPENQIARVTNFHVGIAHIGP